MLSMKKSAMASAILFFAAPLAQADTNNDETAADEGRVEIGYLVCHMTDQDAGVIRSEQKFMCEFDPADDDYANEKYVASFDKIGIDLSLTSAETLRWAVFAPAEKYKDGVLEGDYAGVSADIALGAGIGAKALVGGLKESIALQPVSVTTQTGIGVALGAETLTLTQVPNS